MRGRSRVDAGAVSSASVDDVSLPINRGSDVCEAVTGALDGACIPFRTNIMYMLSLDEGERLMLELAKEYFGEGGLL